MSRARFGAVLLALLVLVLLVTAPARLLASLLPESSVRMSGYSGTVWRGSAASAAIAVDSGWLQLGQLDWDLSVLSLLLLTPRADIESSWGQQTLVADIALSPGGAVRLRDSQVRFSAALIQQFLPVQLSGSLDALINDLRLEQGRPTAGEGRVVWQRAFWRGVRGSQPLGDYVLEFEVPAPMRVQAQVSTLSGPVKIEGTLGIEGNSYQVDVSLNSERGFDSELASALQLMAAPIEGGYQLKFGAEF